VQIFFTFVHFFLLFVKLLVYPLESTGDTTTHCACEEKDYVYIRS